MNPFSEGHTLADVGLALTLDDIGDLEIRLQQELAAAWRLAEKAQERKGARASAPSVTANDERDQWIYEECWKITPYRTIIS
jgi:hypothetical protein